MQDNIFINHTRTSYYLYLINREEGYIFYATNKGYRKASDISPRDVKFFSSLDEIRQYLQEYQPYHNDHIQVRQVQQEVKDFPAGESITVKRRMEYDFKTQWS